MTNEDYLQRLQVAIALGNGQQCEAKSTHDKDWSPILIGHDGSALNIAGSFHPYILFIENYYPRIKPTPKLTPWTFETVPKGVFWTRIKGCEGAVPQSLVSEITQVGILDGGGFKWSWPELLADYEWSPDRTIWQACGVEVGG